MSQIQINDLQDNILEELSISSEEIKNIYAGGLFGRNVEHVDTDGDGIADEKRVYYGNRLKKTKYYR